MEKLVFATNNSHKLSEARDILRPLGIEVVSLADIGCHADIPETADTLEGNAAIKADYVTSHYGLPCFADDTGLEVDALSGAPGVYSARYAGPGHDSQANMTLLLRNMEGKADRRARFRTAIAYAAPGSATRLFEGIVEGSIMTAPAGEKGFGYDPVFMPDGKDRSFAAMDAGEKNAISHRGRALARFAEFIKNPHS